MTPPSRIASITYPSGSLVTNVYDTAGYLHQVKAKPAGCPSPRRSPHSPICPFGPINSVNYGNGIAESWTFDARLPLHQHHRHGILHHAAEPDLQLRRGNNVKTITDAVNAANSQSLNYDVLNRLLMPRAARADTAACLDL